MKIIAHGIHPTVGKKEGFGMSEKVKLQLVALAAAIEMAAETAATKAAEAAAEAAAYEPHEAETSDVYDEWAESESHNHKKYLARLAEVARAHADALADLASLARSALVNIARADVFEDRWWEWHRS